MNCDSTQLAQNAALGPEFKKSSGTCFWSERPPTVWVLEYASTTPQDQQPGTYVGDITSTISVTVDGVIGTRQTAIVTANNPLPPEKGAAQVVYRFTSAGRSYVVYYTREPGEPDFTSIVDNVVVWTLRFSASPQPSG
jgi:hypothetical protein